MAVKKKKSAKKKAVKKRASREKEVTYKDRLFVAYYLDHLNPYKAAIQAGFSETVAKSKSYSWVGNSRSKPKVYVLVKDALEMRLKRLGITADRVSVEIEKLAFSNSKDFYDDEGNLIPPHKLPRDVAAAITEVTEKITTIDGVELREIKYKTENKKGNLELLGKHLAMFTDKSEVVVKDKTEADLTDDELKAELEKYGIKPENTKSTS